MEKQINEKKALENQGFFNAINSLK